MKSIERVVLTKLAKSVESFNQRFVVTNEPLLPLNPDKFHDINELNRGELLL